MSAPIRVLAISHASDVTGAEHSLLNLAPLLADRAVSIGLAARPGGKLEDRWRGLGLTFLPLELPARDGLRHHSGDRYHPPLELLALAPRTARAARRVASAVRQAQADVVHSNSLITHLDCGIAGRLTATAAVIELHEILAPGSGRAVLGVAAGLATRTVAISNAVAQQLPRWARARTTIVGQGVDTARFVPRPPLPQWRARLSAEPDQPIIAAIGRLDPEKGLHHLIHAAAHLRREGINVHVAFVGSPSKDDGGYAADLFRLGTELLPGACRFVPAIDDVSDALTSIDVLACPSDAEPFGLILLEAQSSGIPVVASTVGGPVDFINDGDTGMLVDPGDHHAFAGALLAVLLGTKLRIRLVETALARVRAEHSLEVRADRMAAVYASAATR